MVASSQSEFPNVPLPKYALELSTFRLMLTPIALADWAMIWAYWGISTKFSVTSWALKPEGWPAAASSDLALARSSARWGTLVLVDGKTGAKGLSLPTSA